MAKQYIVSADEEIKDYFNKNFKISEEDIKSKKLDVSLQSVSSIIDDKIKDFIYTSISVVDYYVDGIYNSGKQTSRSKLKLEKLARTKGKKYAFNEQDEKFIEGYKNIRLKSLNEELNKSISDYVYFKLSNELAEINEVKSFQEINNQLASIYDEFFEIIVKEMIVLFKRSQLEEYMNIGIKKVLFVTYNHDLNCPICTAKSNKEMMITDIINEFGIKDGYRHTFCKFSFDPIVSDDDFNTINLEIKNSTFSNVSVVMENRITNLMKKLQIYLPSYVEKDIKFKFVDDISNTLEWNNLLEEYFDQNVDENMSNVFRNSISSLNFNDAIFISKSSLKSQTIESLLLREILRDQIDVSKEVDDLFNVRKESKFVGSGVAFYQLQFVNYLAEDSSFSYLLESFVVYILNPSLLQAIDKDIYNYIKEQLCNSIEF